MIWTFYPFNQPNSFKLNENIQHNFIIVVMLRISCPIIIGPIFGSHVVSINGTLGWDDGISPLPKAKSVPCGCYVKHWSYHIVLVSPNHPYIFLNVHNPTYVKDVQLVLLQHHPPYTNMFIITSSATNGVVRWVVS
jgi:hypothetical protein